MKQRHLAARRAAAAKAPKAPPEMPSHDGKADQHKLRFSLFPIEAFNPILRVLEYGANKYAEHGWRTVPDAERRYADALHRHYVDYLSGVDIDAESGEPSLACVVTNAVFLLAFRMRRAAGTSLTDRRPT